MGQVGTCAEIKEKHHPPIPYEQCQICVGKIVKLECYYPCKPQHSI